MTQIFHEAAPISRNELETIGWKVRDILGFTTQKFLPVPQILEHMLPLLLGDDFTFRVGTMAEMGENHGFADPDQQELVLREDVYDGLVGERGRDRMTGLHELSHLILHRRVRLSRRLRAERPPPYRDPEWQAKCLAGTMMMPICLLDECKTIRQVVREFGVSEDAAIYRIRQIGRALPF